MANPQYLTKSLFVKAVECPTKLYYLNKDAYSNQKNDDAFLEALAKGGFQVGTLARCYYPEGVLIKERDYKSSIAKTEELLKRDRVVIFEAAFLYKDCFVRVDILIKEGKKLKLVEVKSKSYDSNEDEFMGKRGGLISKWKKYIYDISFQKYVISNAHDEFEVEAHLYLADKNKKTSIDGLNQKFEIKRTDGSFEVVINGDVTPTSLGNSILTMVNVDKEIDLVWKCADNEDLLNLSFEEFIDRVSLNYNRDGKINPTIKNRCKKCEFQTNEIEENAVKKSGFKECWDAIFRKHNTESLETIVYNIWDFRSTDKEFSKGNYFMSQLDESIFTDKTACGYLSRKARQKLQYESVINKTNEEYFDKEGLKKVMKTWKYPLHFIDFETSTIAIPFNKNRRPYELIAFQFSRHIVHEDGRIEHIGEYINTEPGKFPNFDFLIELKNQLDGDSGTIFRYALHEKTVLNSIKKELNETSVDELPNKEELIEWIDKITDGDRAMVDMLELVKNYYYSPRMKGSNSLKVVLPTILNESKYLQDKYDKPIYGGSGIPSKNFKEPMIWIQKNGSKIQDPYKLLSPLEYDFSEEEINLMFDGDVIAEGGAAMFAYNQMQFSNMSESERSMLTESLLKYCELDTFAMVLLWEFFNYKCS